MSCAYIYISPCVCVFLSLYHRPTFVRVYMWMNLYLDVFLHQFNVNDSTKNQQFNWTYRKRNRTNWFLCISRESCTRSLTYNSVHRWYGTVFGSVRFENHIRTIAEPDFECLFVFEKTKLLIEFNLAPVSVKASRCACACIKSFPFSPLCDCTDKEKFALN